MLKKPDLLGDSAWQFVYNKIIHAKIEDNEFLERVHAGKEKKLYAGVEIPCLLQIEYELDEKFNTINDTEKYTILKITDNIIEPPKQKNLFEVKK